LSPASDAIPTRPGGLRDHLGGSRSHETHNDEKDHDMLRSLRTFIITIVLTAGALGAAVGCGSAPTSAPNTDTIEASTTLPTAPPAPPAVTQETSLIARLEQATPVHVAPDPSSERITTLERTTELGSVTSLLVIGERDGWFEVALPIRPNGSTGWIDAASVERRETKLRVEVVLDARELRLYDGEEIIEISAIATGAPDTPTPRGAFFVTDLVDTGDADGPYGPYALGLSAHSDQLTEFAGGDGQVGIHGTNDPSSIGNDVSHGCIRLPNDVVGYLVELVPLGTPVNIV
jgi:lipoprotein-anchoring transpeptidase ErfK/SrfK